MKNKQSSNLFKTETFEEEIAQSMHSRLIANRAEKQYSFDKIAKAADFINTAAEILDDTGFSAEAEVLVQVLERLAGSNKKKAIAAKSIGELTEAEMKFFDSLSPAMKKILESHVRKSADGRGYDMGEFVDELKLLYQIRKKKEPFIEMESLTGQNPLSSAPKVDWGQFKADDSKSTKRAKCGCESGHCDHGKGDDWETCKREADPNCRIVDIGHVCHKCFNNYPKEYRKVDVKKANR